MSTNRKTTGYLFDDLTESDFVGAYLNEAADFCFKKCIKDFKVSTLNSEEKNCVFSCQAKTYFAFTSNFGDLMGNNGFKYLKN